jgi:rhamnosyltransferase
VAEPAAKVSVIIPTLNAAKYLPGLLPMLKGQSLPPLEIILVDSSSTDDTRDIAARHGCRVEVIERSNFNHGGTRNLGASLAGGDILIYMTQDVLPADDKFIEELTLPVREQSAAGAYARQIAYPGASPPEKFARDFNYPAASFTKRAEDLPRLGIKAYFFSDAASCVRKSIFETTGRYPENVIVNEDMYLCAKLLQAGHAVAYRAEARVFHSHDYTLRQQFGRYFDVGVFMRQSRDVLKNANSGGEGFRFLNRMLAQLIREGAWRWVPHSVIESACKWVAFTLGYWEPLLPISLKRRLSMHQTYWK